MEETDRFIFIQETIRANTCNEIIGCSQARSKHKMTGGGGRAEGVAQINSPPLRSLGLSILLGTCQIATFVYNTSCYCL